MKQGVFMRQMSADSTETVIDVVGVIGWDVAYQSLRKMLAELPASIKQVTFEIYSPGGSVWEGNGIVQDIGALAARGVKTAARVQVAASMATLIAVACDERSIAQNGRWLIHNPWTMAEGDAAEMEKRAKELRDTEQEAAAFYAKRAGGDADAMLALMDEERWLMPEECKALGFVQSINDPFDMAAYAGVRAEIEQQGNWPMALTEAPPADKGGDDVPGNTAGAEGEKIAEVGAPAQPADVADGENAAHGAGYEDGRAVGKAEAVNELTPQIAELRARLAQAEMLAAEAAKVPELTAQMEVKERERATLQSRVDKLARQLDEQKVDADARLAAMREQLTVATSRVRQYVAGALEFAPAVETWEQAIAACNGDYEKARAKYDGVWRAYMERTNGRNKKGAR
jgi:ATP-dependent protease ClpP protease subunit